MILYGYRVHIYIYIYTNIDAHSWLKRQLKYCFFAKRGSVPTKVVTVLIEFGLRGSTILSFLFEYTVHCRRASPSQDFEIMDQTEDMKLVGGSERQIHKRSLVICTRIALNKRQVCTCLHCIFSIFEWHFLRAIFGGDTCNSCWASLPEPAFLLTTCCDCSRAFLVASVLQWAATEQMTVVFFETFKSNSEIGFSCPVCSWFLMLLVLIWAIIPNFHEFPEKMLRSDAVRFLSPFMFCLELKK